MKIFVTGATGVLGRRVVAGLVEAFHQVVGLSRSEANDHLIGSLGGEPRRGDLFDAGSLRRITGDCEIILHLATRIPTGGKLRRRDWLENDRIRSEGTRALLEAIGREDPKYVILQSVEFLYGDRRGAETDEDTPVSSDLMPNVASAAVMERQLLEAMEQGVGCRILRFGRFYSGDSPTTLSILELISRGRFPVIGDGGYYWNLIHVDDAAAAVVRAVERRDRAEQVVLNVNDDEPVRLGELVRYLAGKTGGGRPKKLPPWLARVLVGGDGFRFLTESSRISNRRAKEILDWTPRYPDYRAGFANVLQKFPIQRKSEYTPVEPPG